MEIQRKREFRIHNKSCGAYISSLHSAWRFRLDGDELPHLTTLRSSTITQFQRKMNENLRSNGGGENRSTLRKLASEPLCPPQIPDAQPLLDMDFFS